MGIGGLGFFGFQAIDFLFGLFDILWVVNIDDARSRIR